MRVLTDLTVMISRVRVTSNGWFLPVRTMVRVSFEPGSPFILLTASLSGRPRIEVPLMAVM